MSEIKNKCKHKFEEIRDNLFWCEKCGTLKKIECSYMSDRCSEKMRTTKLYADLLRGVLKYG